MINKDIAAFWSWRELEKGRNEPKQRREMHYMRPHCYTFFIIKGSCWFLEETWCFESFAGEQWSRNMFINRLGNNQNRMSVVIVASETGNDIVTFSLLQLLRLLGLLGNQGGLMWKWLTDQSISSRICSCGWSNEVRHQTRAKSSFFEVPFHSLYLLFWADKTLRKTNCLL